MPNQDVDSRIVEMQFDARDFDKNIRKSQKNLEDFKKSLNFEDAARQMQHVVTSAGPVNSAILGMAQNVKNLANEFLGIGKVSTYVAQKIKNAWHGALNTIERFGRSMTTVQVDAGKHKYEGLLRSVQTIKNATGDTEETVYRVMETLNNYTDETSYNFADMANNIGKFTTAGVKLTDAEKEMEGIANWAALAGQGVNEAQRAMYNISQAMSAGYMLKIDYKSIQNANMDIRAFRKEALEAAVAMGTLKKEKDGVYKTVKGNKEVNLDNFTETLQFKWFDRKTMEAVFKTFADNANGIGKEAYKAAQRCVTFTDVMSAWKDMLSTGWMKSYEHVFGQLNDAMGLFSGLCNKAGDELKKLVDFRNGILSHWNAGGGRDSLMGALFGELETPDGEILFKGAYGFLDALRDIGEAIRQAFWDFVGEFIDPANKSLFQSDEQEGVAFLATKLRDLTTRFQEFTGKIKDFLFTAGEGETETRFDRIKHAAQAVFAIVTLVVNVVKGIAGFAKNLFGQLRPAFYAVEQLVDYLLQLFTGKVVSGAKNNTIGNFFTTLAEVLRPFTTIINVAVKAVASLIAQIVTMASKSGILQTLGNIFKYLSVQLSNLITKALNSGVLQKVFAWIQNAITKIPGLIQRIKDFGAVLLTTFKGSKTYKGIGDFFKNTFNSKNLKGFLANLKNTLSRISKKIPALFGSIFGSISSSLGDAFTKIFGGSASTEGSDGPKEAIVEAIAKPIEEIGKGNVVAEAIDKAKPGILDTLKTKIKEIWDKITGFFTTLANSEGIQKIKKFFEGTNFQNLLSGSTQLIKWLAVFRTGSGLVSIGKGAKSLGKGLKVMGKNFKNLNLSSLSNMFSNMFNISNIINSNNSDSSIRKNFDFGKLGNQLLQIAAAIAMVAGAAWLITRLNDDELKRAGISIAVIIGALITAGVLAKKFTKNGASLMALAAGVVLLMIPMHILKREPWGEILDSAAKLFVVIAAIAAAGRIAGNIKMKGFVGLAVAVNLLLVPLKILSNMSVMGKGSDMTGSLLKAIMALEAIILSMAIAARLAGGNKMKGMVSLAVSLTLLMIPIKMLANMKLGKAVKGVGLLAGLIFAIVGAIKLTNGAQMTKLAGLIGAITALTFVAWLVSHTVHWSKALVGFGGIILLVLSMALLVKQASKMDAAKLKKVTGIFLAFTLLVGVVAGSIILMDQLKIDWPMVASFLGGITAIVVALGIFLPILGKMNPGSIVKGIVALAGAVVAIMGAIALMIPVIMGSFSSSMNSLTNIASRLKLMSGMLKGFFDDMDSIKETSAQHALNILDRIRTMILSFKNFGDYEPHLRSVLSQLNYLGAGLDALFVNDKKYPANFEDTNVNKILNKLIEMQPSLSGFTVGSLPEELLNLGVGILLFSESAKRVTSTDVPALGLLRGIFGQTNNIEKFTKLPLSEFSGQMSALGGAMSLYAKGASEVTGLAEDGKDIPDISHSIDILKAVCSAISGDDGSGEFKIPANMPDSTALGLFAGQLEALGTALSTFATAAKDMETDTGNATALLSFLAEIGGYITPENLKVVNAFDEVGHADASGTGGKLNQFALDIAALGTALSTFAQNIGGNESEFESGLSVLTRFEELNKKLTISNLQFAKVFNDAGIHKTALNTFADDIGALGHALASFAQNVTMDDGTQADFDYALRAMNFLVTLRNRLPIIGGLHEFFAGHVEKLGELAGDVESLGQSLSDFSNAITGAGNGGSFELGPALDALEFVSKLINIVGLISTELFKDSYDSYGDAVTNFVSFLSTLNSATEGYYNGFDGLTIFQLLVRYAQDMSDAFKEVEGIDTNAVSMFADIADTLSKLVSLDTSSTFSYPGEMITRGLVEGIKKGQSDVVNAVIEVVLAAIDAGNQTAAIKSPSRVFAKMGEYMDAGLVKGLYGNQNDVEKASGSMVTSAVDQASTLIALISQAMSESIDLEPTITPVLDLSQVIEAGSTLESIFEGYSLNMRSALSRASMSVNNGPVAVVVQNPTDISGLTAAVAQMQTDLVNLGVSISNMQIVLQTGVIAGGVTDDVDRNLGRKNLYASRRN